MNLAARLESACKLYPAHILLDEATRSAAQGSGFREFDSIRAWGRAEPVRIFERRQSKPDGERDPLVEPLEHALAAYRRQAFEVAEAGFRQCLEIDPEGGASAVFLERLVALREAPPGIDWERLDLNQICTGAKGQEPMTGDVVGRSAAEETVRLTLVTRSDLPLLEQLVRAYYVEDGHTFREDRQPAALAALVEGEPCGRGWLIRLGARPVGYVVLTWTFSVEAGGREACVDELYLVPEVRNRGLGSRALALVEAEARDLAVRRIFLEVERHNRVIGLYRRAGYLDHDRFLMSKFLSR